MLTPTTRRRRFSHAKLIYRRFKKANFSAYSLRILGLFGIVYLCFVLVSYFRYSSENLEKVVPISNASSLVSTFRLVGHKRLKGTKSNEIVELILDDNSLVELDKHFRSLRPNEYDNKSFRNRTISSTKGFLTDRKSQEGGNMFKEQQQISYPDGFLSGLEAANLMFNGTDSRLKEALDYQYIAYEKQLPYVGNQTYMNIFSEKGINDKRKLLNSLAVFPSASSLHLQAPKNESNSMHGILGVNKYGQYIYKPSPMPPLLGDPRVNMTLELERGGGFYQNLSDAIPLDRDVKESRNSFCKDEKYDITKLDDASIIMTFYNEQLSALLRSIHSILNRTPPPLLREIILVDDHSNLTHLAPGSILYKAIETLPKVKLIRMPERRGIVMARLAGAKLASAPVLVILDSHIEVNEGWLEPQLQRLHESPRSVVMPQIDVIDSEHFNFTSDAGIGCWLGFKWVMQEQASLTPAISNSHVIPSPSMAGGLFAIRADWFWDLGGYDEGFEMWGAENIEMGFRVWMCHGRIECVPCSRVYHIYRKGGSGYKSPSSSLAKNRLRAARVWMDEYSKLAELFIQAPKETEMGNIDRMLELKDKLKCHNFQWYLDHVDPTNEIKTLNDILSSGEIRNVKHKAMCIDTLAKADIGWTWGTYGCHGLHGTQGFLFTKCLAGSGTIQECEHILAQHGKFSMETTDQGTQIVWHPVNKADSAKLCLAMKAAPNGALKVTAETCEMDSSQVEAINAQRWVLERFDTHLKSYHAPTYSEEYLKQHRVADSIHNKTRDEIVWKYGVMANGTHIDQLVLA